MEILFPHCAQPSYPNLGASTTTCFFLAERYFPYATLESTHFIPTYPSNLSGFIPDIYIAKICILRNIPRRLLGKTMIITLNWKKKTHIPVSSSVSFLVTFINEE